MINVSKNGGVHEKECECRRESGRLEPGDKTKVQEFTKGQEARPSQIQKTTTTNRENECGKVTKRTPRRRVE